MLGKIWGSALLLHKVEALCFLPAHMDTEQMLHVHRHSLPQAGRGGSWERHKVPLSWHPPTCLCSHFREQKGSKSSGCTGNLLGRLRICNPNKMAKESSTSVQLTSRRGPSWCFLSVRQNFFTALVTLTWKHLAKTGANRSPGTACVTRECSPHLWVCILQLLGVSGAGLIDMVRLGSRFPYADEHYVICPVYLSSLWGPFCCCARLGLKIHVSLFKSTRIHVQSMCNTSRGLPLLNKFTDLPLTFILVIYIKSF